MRDTVCCRVLAERRQACRAGRRFNVSRRWGCEREFIAWLRAGLRFNVSRGVRFGALVSHGLSRPLKRDVANTHSKRMGELDLERLLLAPRRIPEGQLVPARG